MNQGAGDGATQPSPARGRRCEKIADIGYAFRGGHHAATGHELSMLDDAQKEALEHPWRKNGLRIVRRKEFLKHLKPLFSKRSAAWIGGVGGPPCQGVVFQLVGGEHAIAQPVSDPLGGEAVDMELASVRKVGGDIFLDTRQGPDDRAHLHALKRDAKNRASTIPPEHRSAVCGPAKRRRSGVEHIDAENRMRAGEADERLQFGGREGGEWLQELWTAADEALACSLHHAARGVKATSAPGGLRAFAGDLCPLPRQIEASKATVCYVRFTSISLKNPVFGQARYR